MADPAEACPSPEEIVRWLAGRIDEAARGNAIGRHLASCSAACPENLHVAHAVVADVAEDMAASGGAEEELPEAERQLLDVMAAEATAREKDASRIFAAPPPTWGSLVMAHPDREDIHLLYRLADLAVWHADEKPTEVLAFVAILAPIIEESRADEGEKGRVKALAALAQGVARRTQGDHLGALESYARAEQALLEPVLELESIRASTSPAVHPSADSTGTRRRKARSCSPAMDSPVHMSPASRRLSGSSPTSPGRRATIVAP